MPQAEITVEHPAGLHARPAAVFVRMASGFPAAIHVKKSSAPGNAANAKSILSVLSLGVNQGDCIELNTEGEQAEEALNALLDLVRSNFGESQASS